MSVEKLNSMKKLVFVLTKDIRQSTDLDNFG